MSITYHAEMVTVPDLLSTEIGNHLIDNYDGAFERTDNGDFYSWSFNGRAVQYDPYMPTIFEIARETTASVVKLQIPSEEYLEVDPIPDTVKQHL